MLRNSHPLQKRSPCSPEPSSPSHWPPLRSRHARCFDTVPPNTLVVAKAAAAPTLDGNATDAVWASAKPLTVKLSGGMNFGGKGETTATLKAVTSGDMIYFLLQYADPTNSIRRGAATEAGRRQLEEADRPERQGWRRQHLLRRQVVDHLERQRFDRRLQPERLRGALPRRRRQAVRQQVHRQRRRDRRHVAHEGQPQRRVRASRRPVRGLTRATTRRSRRTPAARAIRAARTTRASAWSTASPSS